jgi:DNA-binding NarL/FixJ family response regulator
MDFIAEDRWIMELVKIRLLIVEDQPDVRKLLQLRLAVEEDIDVVGEAVDGETALTMATFLCPDIVLVDVDMPGTDGLQIVSELYHQCPQTAIIVLSIHDDASIKAKVAEIGAEALVVKSLPADTLLSTIREVAGKHIL